MKVDFNNIRDHIISIEGFALKWLFTEEKYSVFPKIHFDQLKPLDKKAAKFLWDFISETDLHANVPFRKNYFRYIDKAKIESGNQKEIKKWLYQRGLPFEKEVYLSYSPDDAMIVPWKILIKYFDSFYFSDLTIIDESLQWALLFYHEDEIYFGTNKDFKLSETFEDYDFIW